MGLLSEVEDTYKDAIAAVGQTQALLVGLAECYEEHGDCESAVSHYEVARQLAEDEVVEAQIDELISEVEATCQ